jgi:hypothetical protein
VHLNKAPVQSRHVGHYGRQGLTSGCLLGPMLAETGKRRYFKLWIDKWWVNLVWEEQDFKTATEIKQMSFKYFFNHLEKLINLPINLLVTYEHALRSLVVWLLTCLIFSGMHSFKTEVMHVVDFGYWFAWLRFKRPTHKNEVEQSRILIIWNKL